MYIHTYIIYVCNAVPLMWAKYVPSDAPPRLPGIDNGCTAKNCLAGTTTGGDDR